MRSEFYRHDIDGLRALAVLPVVLFHGNVPGFSGGFVGVDVFFVVSGFLITQILMRHIDQRDFSIALFYQRRVRRIAPALFLVLVVSSVLAVALLLPEDLIDFGESLLATVFFSSNLYFWSNTGYFAVPAEFKPLLHTWSLAVEEQFYILYPLFLYWVHRQWRAWLVPLLWLGLLLSFALSVWGTSNAPGAAFYLPVTRAWELLLGAMLALHALPAITSPALRELLAAFGSALIVWSVFTFSSSTSFPGLAALAPCLGAGLYIHANTTGSTVAGRLLSLRPVVALGLISYSLYLWHWPLLVFAKYYLVRHLYPAETTLVIIVAVALSAVSWRWVEQPFRRTDEGFNGTRIFRVAAVSAALVTAVGIMLVATGGLRDRFQASDLQLLAEAGLRDPDRLDCLNPEVGQVMAGELCIIGERNDSPPAFVLWGDSHAEAIRPALAEVARETGTWGYFAFHVFCPPLLGVENRLKPASHHCAAFNQAMADWVRQTGVTEVVLGGMWGAYPQGVIQSVGSVGGGVDTSRVTFEAALSETLSFLDEAGARVWLVAQVPLADVDVGRALAVRRRYGIPLEDIEPSYSGHLVYQAFVTDIFEEAVASGSTRVVDPADILCNGERCKVLENGRSLYSDDDHLSHYGARHVAPIFTPLVHVLSGR